MAKTIKFNLICDGNPVRTIEDLRNNFSIEDILAYYHNKLLHRWLEVRGYQEQLKKVSEMKAEKNLDIIKELIRIFDVVAEECEVEGSIYILEYLEERKKLYSVYKQEDYEVKKIIADYENGYRKLTADILKNPDDAAKIKANIKEIVMNYSGVLQLNHRELFHRLSDKSPLAIMCLLMNPHTRNYYLPVEIKNEDGTVTRDIDINQEKKIMYENICNMIKTTEFKEKLGENLRSFAGVTDGYWKDLETNEKQYMIIGMDNGNFVRSSGKFGGDLGYSAVRNQFVIVDGIDYKCNSKAHKLLYMEV